jgi:N,N'-diacetyllegionaminate synthase
MITIGNRIIQQNGEPFIIAEVGINHNGNLETAFKMIEVAKHAKVDAVKFQTFKASEFVGDPNQMFTYQSQGKTVTESMLEMFTRYEFDTETWTKVKKKCDDEGIVFLSTPQNFSDLEVLVELGVSAIKVGSDDFTNIPLLKQYKQKGLPMMISCGMADMTEVNAALNAVGALEGFPVVLLLCTSEYPTPPESVNLRKLKTLGNSFPNLILGFSDHTLDELASSLAVAYGAVVFEKHFTLDRNLPGPDHWFSEDPEGLEKWVNSIRRAYKMLGSEQVQPTAKEMEMRVLARRSIVAIKNIARGEIFNENNIGLRRPGSGIAPVHFPDFLGKEAKADITKGTLITWENAG